MENSRQLALEIAHTCCNQLESFAQNLRGPDEAVQCALSLGRNLGRRIEKWPETRLHRALGFIQGVLVARGITSYEEQLALIDNLKVAFPEDTDDDLEEHRNPKSPFQLELGGLG